jgi:hypothetical protein
VLSFVAGRIQFFLHWFLATVDLELLLTLTLLAAHFGCVVCSRSMSSWFGFGATCSPWPVHHQYTNLFFASALRCWILFGVGLSLDFLGGARSGCFSLVLRILDAVGPHLGSIYSVSRDALSCCRFWFCLCVHFPQQHRLCFKFDLWPRQQKD